MRKKKINRNRTELDEHLRLFTHVRTTFYLVTIILCHPLSNFLSSFNPLSFSYILSHSFYFIHTHTHTHTHSLSLSPPLISHSLTVTLLILLCFSLYLSLAHYLSIYLSTCTLSLFSISLILLLSLSVSLSIRLSLPLSRNYLSAIWEVKWRAAMISPTINRNLAYYFR